MPIAKKEPSYMHLRSFFFGRHLGTPLSIRSFRQGGTIRCPVGIRWRLTEWDGPPPPAWRPPFFNPNTKNSTAGASTPITIERAPARSLFATRVPSLPSEAVVKPRSPAARLISDGGSQQLL